MSKDRIQTVVDLQVFQAYFALRGNSHQEDAEFADQDYDKLLTSIKPETFALWLQRIKDEDNEDSILSLSKDNSVKLYRDSSIEYDRSIEFINYNGHLQVLISSKENKRKGTEKTFKPKLLLSIDKNKQVICQRVVEGQVRKSELPSPFDTRPNRQKNYEFIQQGMQRKETGFVHTTDVNKTRKKVAAKDVHRIAQQYGMQAQDSIMNPMHTTEDKIVLIKDTKRHVITYGGDEVMSLIDTPIKTLSRGDIPYYLDQVGARLNALRERGKAHCDFKTQNFLLHREKGGKVNFTVIDDWPEHPFNKSPYDIAKSGVKLMTTPGVSCPPSKYGDKDNMCFFFKEDTGFAIEEVIDLDTTAKITEKTVAFYDSYAFLVALCAICNPKNLDLKDKYKISIDITPIYKEAQDTLKSMLELCDKIQDNPINYEKPCGDGDDLNTLNLGNITNADGPFSLAAIVERVAEKIPGAFIDEELTPWLYTAIRDARERRIEIAFHRLANNKSASPSQYFSGILFDRIKIALSDIENVNGETFTRSLHYIEKGMMEELANLVDLKLDLQRSSLSFRSKKHNSVYKEITRDRNRRREAEVNNMQKDLPKNTKSFGQFSASENKKKISIRRPAMEKNSKK